MSGDLGGFSMFELFRQEVATHARTIEESLERFLDEPGDREQARAAMHAAHSLKGAARIIEAGPAEQVAGAMENCFEAAAEGRVRIIDCYQAPLRSALGFLVRLSGASEAEATSPSNELAAEARDAAAAIGRAEQGDAGETAEAQPAPAASGAESSMADLSMMELFKVEVENQAAQLNTYLLDLEYDLADPGKIEPVMRTAHSIKGAARIVGLDALTGLAHIMEDVLVEAQKGAVSLTEDHMDLIFRTADVFSRLAGMTTGEIARWPQENEGLVGGLTESFQGALKGEKPVVSEPAGGEAEQSPPKPAPPEPPAQAPATASTERESVVRVSSENLNRLMSLSAESLVQSRRLQPMSKTMADHKSAHLRMAALIDRMQEEVGKLPHSTVLAGLIGIASDHNDAGLRAVADHQEELDSFAQHNTLLGERLYREVVASRMRQFGDAADGFRRMVRDIARSLKKKVKLEIVGRSTPVDRDVLEDLKAPLNHILRNSLDHGIETPEERAAAGKPEAGTIRVEVRHHAGMLLIEASDDGRGIDLDRLRQKVVDQELAAPEMAANLSDAELLEFPFLPGFSTAAQVTDVSGRGVGLDVVQTMVREAGGTVRLSTRPGKGMAAHLYLPITRSVLRALVVIVDGEPYAFPLTGVRRCLTVPGEDLRTAEGRQYIEHDGDNIGLVSAREALELGPGSPGRDAVRVVVLGDKGHLYGVEVDRFVGQEDFVIRPLDPRLGKVANISAAALLEDGSPLLIIDVDDLIQTIDTLLAGGRLGRARKRTEKSAQVRRKTVLVVDDSITVRETERKLLENRGYGVDVAVDGVDGWNAVRLGSYDLVVSDVDMPRMTGIELVRRIREDSRLKSMPVMIVSYKDREEDRMAGLDAGANYYLTKSSFQDEALLEAVADLIGEAGE